MAILKELKKKLTKKADDEDNKSLKDGSGVELEDSSEDDEDQPRFIKKDVSESEKSEEEKLEKAKEEINRSGIIEDLEKDHSILPESYQQRNLDRETGGLEENKKEGHYAGKDVWDDRSEEVDKMGSTEVFNTSGMRSVIWMQKRKRLEAKKKHKEAAQNTATVVATKKGTEKDFDPNKPFDSRVDIVLPQQGYVARLKHLKVDRSHESGHDGGITR